MDLTIAKYSVSLACVLLVVVPLVFVFHNVYQDGPWGRMALGSVAAFAFFLGMEIWTRGDPWAIAHFGALLILSFAAFLVWHLWRFHRRVLLASRAAPPEARPSANDAQQVIVFHTYAPICPDRGGHLNGNQLCRHRTRGWLAFCGEQECPKMRQPAPTQIGRESAA